MTNINVTLSNWREVFCGAINRAGFQSASDLLYNFPACPYESVVEKLGFPPTEDNVLCMEILHREEAIRQKQRKYAIMDVLVRFINRDKICWDKKHKHIEKRVGKTYYGWYSFVNSCIKNVTQAVKGAKAKQVWDILEMLTIGQPNWCPKSVDDPYIVQAFKHIDW